MDFVNFETTHFCVPHIKSLRNTIPVQIQNHYIILIIHFIVVVVVIFLKSLTFYKVAV
jgi:hypothetical protein